MTTKAAYSSLATAMALVGRTSRACDVCANKSAHWYCAADEAYLCDRCDTQVHSANSLALRHERSCLTPNGTPRKLHRRGSQDTTKQPKKPQAEERFSVQETKKLQPPPPEVLPSRKRSRTSRPHPHNMKELSKLANHGAQQKAPKIKKLADSLAIKAELELHDFLDTEEFLSNGNQEVPSFITVTQDSPSGSDFDILSPDFEVREPDHSASADSFALFFKGKAAHSQDLSDSSDQCLVPATFDYCLDSGMEVGCEIDGNIDLAGDDCFIPSDIPGLDGFEDFGSKVDLSDDFSLSFDLAVRNGSEAFEGEGGAASEIGGTTSDCKKAGVDFDQFTAGPFAKFFAQKTKSEMREPMSPEKIKDEAKEILRCCLEGEDDVQKVPLLRLNYEAVLIAWSDGREPWVDYKVPNDGNCKGDDVGLVPDIGEGAADDNQSGGGREARVLRYKEKRRTRLFSKKIRYEVRKLNAERRPRMKGRFVKRTSTS